MSAAVASASSNLTTLGAPDKYRGAVVEVSELPTSLDTYNYHPKFFAPRIFSYLLRLLCPKVNLLLGQWSLHMSAISPTYREWISICLINCFLLLQTSVLDKNRKPLGYLDVAALKQKWEAGQLDPVSVPQSRFKHILKYSLERPSISAHDEIQEISLYTIHRDNAFNTDAGT